MFGRIRAASNKRMRKSGVERLTRRRVARWRVPGRWRRERRIDETFRVRRLAERRDPQDRPALETGQTRRATAMVALVLPVHSAILPLPNKASAKREQRRWAGHWVSDNRKPIRIEEQPRPVITPHCEFGVPKTIQRRVEPNPREFDTLPGAYEMNHRVIKPKTEPNTTACALERS